MLSFKFYRARRLNVNKGKLEVHLEKLNEGFMTSDEIQYVAKAGNFREKGFDWCSREQREVACQE